MSIIFYILLKSVKAKVDFVDRIFTFTIILILFFTMITFIVAGIAKIYAPIEIRFGNIESWIGFSGSILGSSITMFALVFTITNENKKREDDVKKQNEVEAKNLDEKKKALIRSVMPIPFIKPLSGLDGEFIIQDGCINFTFVNQSSNPLYLRNVGISICLLELEGRKIDEDTNLVSIKPRILILGDRLVAGNTDFTFKVDIMTNEVTDLGRIALKKYRNVTCNLMFKIEYSDILDLQKYEMVVGYYLTLKFDLFAGSLIYKIRDTKFETQSMPIKIDNFSTKAFEY
jgi:hypothetical protein